MTTEAALMQLAARATEQNLEVRSINFTFAGKSHDYRRTIPSADAVTPQVEVAVRCGHTTLTLVCAGAANAEQMRELHEAAAMSARRIELCGTIIGTSQPMLRLKELVELASECDSTTLICGESGTGKELVAQMIHNLSPRAEKPFITINCGALTDTLLESELFGYVKGAFTGATSNKKGLFEAAHKGTIFLDEFGEMSPQMQIRLLRLIVSDYYPTLSIDGSSGSKFHSHGKIFSPAGLAGAEADLFAKNLTEVEFSVKSPVYYQYQGKRLICKSSTIRFRIS